MNRSFSLVICLLVVASLVLPGCGGASPPGGPTCRQGICVELKLQEPIRFNERVPVTITVRTDRDIPRLGIFLGADSNAVLVEENGQWVSRGPAQQHLIWEERGGWRVDAKANRPIQIASAVRFPPEGGDYDYVTPRYFTILADAVELPGGSVVTDGRLVRMTRAGGMVDPPREIIEQDGRTPIPFDTRVPGPTPPPREKPTPWNRALPRLWPEEILSRCGWAPSSSPLTHWDELKLWVDVPEQVPLNVPVTVVVGLEAKKRDERPGQAKMALCLTDPNIRIEGEREWQVEVRAGVVVTVSTIVRFTQAGEIELLVGAYDPATGRVMNGGQRTRASASAKTSQSQGFGGWLSITQETFEGVWPSTGWTVHDLSNDGYDRHWDDDAYRAYTGSWAAWPARGGTHGRDPVPGDDDYFNNMDTRMIYGPFDLSDAVMADTDFWLWRETEANYDYLAFEVSHDGVAFQELARWTGSAGWEFQDIYFNDYVGDASVWVAWRFVSDSSLTYDGPWVDNVRVWKFVPGEVAVQGTLYYYDRSDARVAARFARVYLYDDDGPTGPDGSDDLLAETTTGENGLFQLPTLQNWDVDDSNANPFARRLDLYLAWEADSKDGLFRRLVTDLAGYAHRWPSETRTDIGDGMADLSATIPNDHSKEGAMWIYQDMRSAWEYVLGSTTTSPGPATVRWQAGTNCFFLNMWICNSGFWPASPLYGIFVSNLHIRSSDTVIHEVAHQYMYTAMGEWFWQQSQWYDWISCIEHDVFSSDETALCAWTEGWADFFPMAVQGIQVFNGYNLETATWGDQQPTGDRVEGRVAGALYDLFDNTNDGWDQVSFGFVPIWDIIRAIPRENNFPEFWGSWRSRGYNQHWAVQSIYQNTIDYDTSPTIANLPDLTMLQNSTWNNAIDLWAYSSDAESSDWELAWIITNVTDWRCGASIDAWGNVDLAPQAGWFGSCDVTIRVSDGIKTGSDTFTVNVRRIVTRIYLPIIMKGPGSPPPYPILLNKR